MRKVFFMLMHCMLPIPKNLFSQFILFVLILVTANVQVSIAQSTPVSITIHPSKDNTIYQRNTSNSNGAGEFFIAGTTGSPYFNHGLIMFDIAGNIPAGAVIQSATLTLHLAGTSGNSGPYNIELHRLLQDWGEGSSNAGTQAGQGAPAATNDATWANTFYPSSLWSSAGGSFSAATSADQLVNGIGFYSWSSPGMITDIQDWINNPSANYGWLLKSNELASFQAKKFSSRENTIAANRPVLSVTYTLEKPGEWTWVKGDTVPLTVGVYGVKGVPADSNKPGSREGRSVTWTDASGNLWLFGGSSNLGYFNDLWKYNIQTNQWTWIKGDNVPGVYGVYGTMGVPAADNKPGSRNGAVGWTDSAGNLWLFGGRGFGANIGNNGNLNDLWKYNIATNEWTWMKGDIVGPSNPGSYGTPGVAAPSNRPSARELSTGWVDTSGNFWLFGGQKANGELPNQLTKNDLWKYNVATNEWTWMKGDSTFASPGNPGTIGVPAATNNPVASYGGAGWIDDANNLWLLDGSHFYHSNRLWKYNIATNQWVWLKGGNNLNVYGTKGIPSPANTPSARGMSYNWKDKFGNFWLFGGLGLSTPNQLGMFSDLWRYDPSTNEWTWMKGGSTINDTSVYGVQGVPAPANKPGLRYQGMSFTDFPGNFWLFGGYGVTTFGSAGLSDFWKFTPPDENGTTPPVLSDINKLVNPNIDMSFQLTDFTNAFSDPDGNSITKIKITHLPVHGTLKLGNAPVQLNQEIYPDSPTGGLAYITDTSFVDIDSIGWNGADNNSYANQPAKIILRLNQPPVVSITSPVNNATYPAGSVITLNAVASDADGTITKVEFYNNGIKFLEDASDPYRYATNEAEPGNYALTAKATDSHGGTSVSDTVRMSITGCIGGGAITAKGYTNIPGTEVADLTNDPAYPDGSSINVQLGMFEYSNAGDNYGGRLRGYICAPLTGNYTFYIAGDDQAGLWLSTDDNPANKVLIAYNLSPVGFRAWTATVAQKSKPIKLIKGVRYYIETLHKQSVGDNHLSVRWVLPNGLSEAPIPGSRLSPYETAQPFTNSITGFETSMRKFSAQEDIPGRLTATVIPNPSTGYFTLITKNNSNEPLSFIVTDVAGRVVEKRLNIAPGSNFRFGNNYKAGIYFIEIIQGAKSEKLKLIRL